MIKNLRIKEFISPAALGYAACYQRDARNEGNKRKFLRVIKRLCD